jgi:hypothetical protein
MCVFQPNIDHSQLADLKTRIEADYSSLIECGEIKYNIKNHIKVK